MSTEVNSTNFLGALSKAIPDTNIRKTTILNYAKLLLLAAEQNGGRALLEDPVVKKAIKLYQRCNPEAGRSDQRSSPTALLGHGAWVIRWGV